MDVEQIELLPCPFCGGKAKLHERTERQEFSAADAANSGMGQSAGSIVHTIREVHCECGVRGGGFRVSELWNTRAALTPPEGYVLVPVERTEEMNDAGCMALAGSIGGYESACVSKCWSAMLAARPKVKP